MNVNCLTTGAMRQRPWGEILLVGGALLAILLLLAAPCERSRCLLPGDAAQAQAADSHSTFPTKPLLAAPLHCALHCGLFLLPLLIAILTPGLRARLPVRALAVHVPVTVSPPLPPPQAA